jgi:hypothetical protein
MRVPPATWRAVFQRDRGICRYCDEDLLSSFSSYWAATVDHVHAVAAGGPDDEENLVLSCPACNGMLCRSGHLLSVAERRAYVSSRRSQELAGFEEWRAELRGPAP